MPNKVVISLEEVGLCYSKGRSILRNQKYWALKDISFDLYQNETLGVIGRNGVGKSSLLRLIAGIYKPDVGSVTRSVDRIVLLSLQVGFLPHLSGKENIILSGLLLGCSKKLLQEKLDDIVEFAGIGEFIEEPVQTYSAGMRARLGFSVAIHTDSNVLLIDETLGVGDQDFRKKSSEALNKIITSDKSVVLVSHNLQTISTLCNRVVWIENGQVVMCDNTEVVLQAYKKVGQNVI